MKMIKPPIIYRKRVKEEEEGVYGPEWIEYAFKGHLSMSKRLKKTLYYGRQPKTDRPSLPMTEIAVEIFSQATPHSLGDINMNFAASVSRNACMSPCSLILAMAYLERLRTRRPEYLQNISSSNLFLVSMLVASKFLYDEGEDEEVFNDEWAEAANIETKEMNDLEMKFLSAIDWNLYMEPMLFKSLLSKLEHAVAKRKSKERGWCTYTELDILTDCCFDYLWCWHLLSDMLIKVVALSAVAYVTSALVMVGTVATQKNLERTIKELITTRTNFRDERRNCQSSNSLEIIDNSSSAVLGLLTTDQVNNENRISDQPALSSNYTFDLDHSSENIGVGGIIQSLGKPFIIQRVNISAIAEFIFNVSPYVDLKFAPAFR